MMPWILDVEKVFKVEFLLGQKLRSHRKLTYRIDNCDFQRIFAIQLRIVWILRKQRKQKLCRDTLIKKQQRR